MNLPPREAWARALAAIEPERLAALARPIAARVRVEPLQPAGEGSMLLQLRDSVAGCTYHLGEIPVVRVALRLVDGAQVAEGGAVLLSDDLERATHIAILDAALAAGLPESQAIAGAIAEGIARWAGIEEVRANILATTRVEFELLSRPEGAAASEET